MAVSFGLLLTIGLQLLVLCTTSDDVTSEDESGLVELEDFIEYAHNLQHEHPEVKKRETSLSDANYNLMANYFAFNGGVEKFYIYEDAVKEHYNGLKLSVRKKHIIDELDQIYDPHFVNWFARLIAADPSSVFVFTKIAEEVAEGKIPARSMRRDPKTVFKRFFMGDEERSEKAHKTLAREMFRSGAEKFIDEILQLGIAVHKSLLFYPQLFHILIDELMTLVGKVEKHRTISSVLGRLETSYPGKYRTFIDPYIY